MPLAKMVMVSVVRPSYGRLDRHVADEGKCASKLVDTPERQLPSRLDLGAHVPGNGRNPVALVSDFGRLRKDWGNRTRYSQNRPIQIC